MGGGLESRCVGRVYGADGAVRVAKVERGSDKHVARNLGSNTKKDILNRPLKPSDAGIKGTNFSAKSLLFEVLPLENLNTVLERHKDT